MVDSVTVICPLCGEEEIMTYEDGILKSDVCMGGCFKLPIEELDNQE